MGDDDYAFVGGGSLKLKGVKGSRVDKRKRHKSKLPDITPDDQPVDEARDQVIDDAQQQQGEPEDRPGAGYAADGSSQESSIKQKRRDGDDTGVVRKTAAELRHEERRRKMLNDRLKREGNKTHKERVEELNKYLSGLSEHHDMPRIGPG